MNFRFCLKVTYLRKDADVNDIRFFRNFKELNFWLSDMFKLNEEYYIISIEEEES